MNSSSLPPNQPKLYLVGYSHLDTQWCWSYPLVVENMLLNTLKDNFDALDAHPNYILNFSGATRYDMMKEFHPEEYEKLKIYVQNGQWFPCGASMEECDVLVPNAESLIRNVLLGNQFFQKEFGTTSCEFMLPDCFGFPTSLPSILAHCGIKGFSTQKLSWGSAEGIPFNLGWWYGEDGNGVIAALNGGAYVNFVQNDWSRDEKWISRLQKDIELSGGVALDYSYFGTGDQGGCPGMESAEWCDKFATDKTSPINVIPCKADQLFNDLTEDELALLQKNQNWKGDLLLTEHSAGSATSQSYMKRWFHQSEIFISTAEQLATAANYFAHCAYPQKTMAECWRLLCLNMFHDVLPGTSLPLAYEFSHNDAQVNLNLLQGVILDSVCALAQKISTELPPNLAAICSEKFTPVIVSNSLATTREDICQIEISLPEGTSAITVHDQTGKCVNSQFEILEKSIAHIEFCAKVKSLSLTPFWIIFHSKPIPNNNLFSNPKSECQISLEANSAHLENDFYQIQVSAQGDIVQIYDKIQHRNILENPIRWQLLYEEPEIYPAWNMDWNDRQHEPSRFLGDTGETKLIAKQNTNSVTLEIQRQTNRSQFKTKITLHGGEAGKRIEFFDSIDWREISTSLKVAFPLTSQNPMATYNWDICSVERGNNEEKKFEVPSHQWIDLTDISGKYGATIFTGSKYSSDKPSNNTLRLTLLYTPGVSRNLHHQHQETQDWGRHEIRYALVAHGENFRTEQIPQQAKGFDQPLLAFETTPHKGEMPDFSLAKISTPSIDLLAIKPAEDQNGIVFRIVNNSPNVVQKATLDFAFEIVDFSENNGQEQEIPNSASIDQISPSSLEVSLRPWQILTLRLIPQNSSAQPEKQISQLLEQSQLVDICSKNKMPAESWKFPEEQFPNHIEFQGKQIPVSKFALPCLGQTLDLNEPNADHILLITSTTHHVKTAQFFIDETPISISLPASNELLARWDTRLWDRPMPKLTWEWGPLYTGLEQGFIHRNRLAAFCHHIHSPEGRDLPWTYGQLFLHILPAGKLRLPKNSDIQIVSACALKLGAMCSWISPNSLRDAFPDYSDISLAPRIQFSQAQTARCAPSIGADGSGHGSNSGFNLYGTVAPGGIIPEINPSMPISATSLYSPSPKTKSLEAQQKENQSLKLEISLPWYHSPGNRLEVSLNNSAWQAVSEPIYLSKTTHIQARYNSHLSSIVARINDLTPPELISAQLRFGNSFIELRFNEPLHPNLEEIIQNSELSETNAQIVSLNFDNDYCGISIQLDRPIEKACVLFLRQLRDISGNTASETRISLQPEPEILIPETIDCSECEKIIDLPAEFCTKSEFSLSAFIFSDCTLTKNTLIAGISPNPEISSIQPATWNCAGQARFLAYTHALLCFWGDKIDIATWKELELKHWQHLAITWDGELVRIYVNAQLVGQGQGRFNSIPKNAKIIFAPQATWSSDPEKHQRFQGKIARFCYSNYAKTAAEIQSELRQTPFQDIDYKTMQMNI